VKKFNWSPSPNYSGKCGSKSPPRTEKTNLLQGLQTHLLQKNDAALDFKLYMSVLLEIVKILQGRIYGETPVSQQ
jgi:hypothetical protein